jgi:ABC-2 type transport system ATP-binding protein
MFDEPVNGLDPDGIRWVRQFVRHLAAEGRTVLVSSHLMSEMEDTADHLVVIGRGRLVADAPIAEVIAGSSHTVVRVRTPGADELARLLAPIAGGVRQEAGDRLLVSGLGTDQIGDVAYTAGIRLHELTLHSASLEEAYLELSQHNLEFGASQLEQKGA